MNYVRVISEFDECTLTDPGCEQTCINTLGGYECACKIGYQLHSDGKHCEGWSFETWLNVLDRWTNQ